MTHDELLAKINYYTVCTQPTKPEMVCDNEHLKEFYPEWFALRAVVKLITKEDTIPLDDYHFGYMAACKDIYEAIEKELSND